MRRCNKCCLKLEVTDASGELIPGPQGSVGLRGRVITQTPRSLKVQMIGDEIIPVINQGFLWEAEVLPPPEFSLPGTFTFYRATVLDQEGLSVAEMFNSNGGINHTQVDEVHTSVLLQYRNGKQLDMHSVSSKAQGTENFLLAQTLHDVVINDQLYFAISPNTSSLTTFNYNLSSVKTKPSAKLGRCSFVTFPLPGTSAGQVGCLVVTDDLKAGQGFGPFVSVSAAAGGGGAGQESFYDGNKQFIGRGGGGGGIATNSLSSPWNQDLAKGDVIEVFPGIGGSGGSDIDPDGKQGQESYIKLNGVLATGIPNPAPGGFGGKGGVNGGDGADSVSGGGGGGGGGGAGLIAEPPSPGIPGTPGLGGSASRFTNGATGGTNPRDGGFSTSFNGGTVSGGKGGTNNTSMGSGGGAGGVGPSNGSSIPSGISNGGDGGAAGIKGEPGKPGSDGNRSGTAVFVLAGGGGGSGGIGTTIVVVPGGFGGKGTDAQISFQTQF